MRLRIRTLIFALLLAGIGTTALAAEFSIVPAVQVGTRYDSNARFLPDGSKTNGSQGIIFDISLPMVYRSAKSSISLNPRVVRSFFRKEENADLEDRDQFLTGGASRSFRRSSIGAGYGYTNLSLRTSEFGNPGEPAPGEPPSGSGRLFINDDTQKSWFFQPNWQYMISPTYTVSLNGGYREVRYDEKGISQRFDFDTSNATVAFQHAFNDRHQLALQTNLSQFDSENEDLGVTNSSSSNGLSLVYTYSWSDRASISANFGWARTMGTVKRPNAFFPVSGAFLCNPVLIVCEFDSDSTNFVGNLTASRRSETTQYQLAFGQSISPSSNGAQQLVFNFNASVSKRFSNRFSGNLGILVTTQSNVGDSRFDFGSDVARSILGLNYQLKRNWSLFGIYTFTFTRQDSVLSNNFDSRNHFVSVGIRFQGDGWRW